MSPVPFTRKAGTLTQPKLYSEALKESKVVMWNQALGLHVLGCRTGAQQKQGRVSGRTLTGGQLEIPPLPKKNSSLCTTMEVCLHGETQGLRKLLM